MPDTFLSIIIPAYNEEKRLPKTLQQLFDFLKKQSYTFEVLVVENGSQDQTYNIAQRSTEKYPQLQVLRVEQAGKGRAVQRGMLEARGDYRFMCDADFSMPVEQINRFLPPSLEDFDIAIASREAPGAVRYNEPQYRHIVGRIFNTLIRLLAVPELHDTQCGFKCFRAHAAEELFSRQTVMGWSFDVEILFVAGLLGFQIEELPIPWYHNPESKISVLTDSFQMALDIFSIRLKSMRGAYNNHVKKI